MKLKLLKSTVLAASLLGALSSASAETLKARIPFEFSAGGTTMPAGHYVIRPLPNAPSVLVFENETTKMQAIVFARTSSNDAVAKPAAAPMTFVAGSIASMELTGIASAAWIYELSASPVRGSLKRAALALSPSGK